MEEQKCLISIVFPPSAENYTCDGDGGGDGGQDNFSLSDYIARKCESVGELEGIKI